MAENKKSFVAYTNWGNIFDELTNEEAGLLVKHLFDYVRDKNPTAKDKLTKMMFIQMKDTLKRDLSKYDKYIDKQRINGAKGGRPPKPKETQETQPFITKPKKADSVSDNDSVNVNDINKKVYKKIDNLILYQNEFEKLNQKYSIKDIHDILEVIENRTDNKKRKSLYLTANNWLSRNKKEQKLEFKSNR